MDWKEFFKPTLRKIIISFSIPFIWIIILLIIRSVQSALLKLQGVAFLIIPFVKPEINYLILIPYLILGLIINTIYHYPLGCFISKLFDNYKRDNLKKVFTIKNVFLLILLILIFNPFFPRIIYGLILFQSSPIAKGYYPCGVEIISVNEKSPVQIAGISKGEIILDAYSNDLPSGYISSTLRFNDFFSRVKAGDDINIVTNKDNYKIKVGMKEDGGPYLGVTLNTTFCRCGDGVCEKGEKYTYEKIVCSTVNGEPGPCNPSNFTMVNCKLDCE